MRTLFLLTLSAALVLSACSGGEDPGPVRLPQEPPGVQHLDDAGLEAQLDTVQTGLQEVTGTSVSWEAVYDVTESGPAQVIAHYDDWLTEQGWEPADGPTDIRRSLGASWRRDGQSVVLMTLWDLEGRDLAILAVPSEGDA